MNKPSDETIIELYHEHVNAQPPASLNQHILSYAERENTPKTHKHRHFWGVAAGIAAVLIMIPFATDHIDNSKNQHQVQPTVHATPAQVESLQQIVATESELSEQLVSMERQRSFKIELAKEPKPSMSKDRRLRTNNNQPVNKQFKKIIALLETNKPHEAKAALKLLLAEQPQLKTQLPDKLKKLLNINNTKESKKDDKK